MGERYWYKEVVPFMAMVSAECTSVGLKILFKLATSKGMNYFVFIFYSYAFATVVLLLLTFIFHRRTGMPALNLSILSRIVLLGLIGMSAQMIGFKGLDYSTPELSSAMSNLMPSSSGSTSSNAKFHYYPTPAILADKKNKFSLYRHLSLRGMEKITLSSWRSRAKVLGTIVSILGALTAVLYKGPMIFSSAPSISFHNPLSSSQNKWVIGGVLLSTQYLLLAFWGILQTHIIRMYPAEVTVSLASAPICFLSERNLNSWMLGSNIAIVTVIYAAFFGPSYSTVVHSWGMRIKGPVYTVTFNPLSIVIAAAMGFVFLGDALTVGSVLGAIIISVGFYAVIWGKAKEDKSEEHEHEHEHGSSNSNTPLLHIQN